jgi:hypothetical protein
MSLIDGRSMLSKNYHIFMRYILSILLLISISATAQQPTGNPTSYNGKWYRYTQFLGVDSALLVGNKDTNWTPRQPAIVLWEHSGVDTSLWLYDKYWRKVGSSGGSVGSQSLQQVTTIGNSTNKGIRITNGTDTAISLNNDGSGSFSNTAIIWDTSGNISIANIPTNNGLATYNENLYLGEQGGSSSLTLITLNTATKTITSNADSGYIFNGGDATFQGSIKTNKGLNSLSDSTVTSLIQDSNSGGWASTTLNNGEYSTVLPGYSGYKFNFQDLGAVRTYSYPDHSCTIDNISTATTSAGIGFVKANGTNITFDNTSYYSAADTGRGNTKITTGYDLNKVRDSLQTNINTKGSGTVTSISTGLGLSGGTIINTGTIAVDTSSTSILSRQRAAVTYQTIGNYALADSTVWQPKYRSDTARINLYAAINGKQPTLTANAPISIVSNVIKVDTATRFTGLATLGKTYNDSLTLSAVSNAKLNTSDTLSMLNNRINAISLITSGTIHTSPTTFVRSGGTWTGTMSLASQSPYTLFGRGSGNGTPSFSSIDSNYFNGGFATQVRAAQTTGLTGNGTVTTALVPLANWSVSNSKLSSTGVSGMNWDTTNNALNINTSTQQSSYKLNVLGATNLSGAYSSFALPVTINNTTASSNSISGMNLLLAGTNKASIFVTPSNYSIANQQNAFVIGGNVTGNKLVLIANNQNSTGAAIEFYNQNGGGSATPAMKIVGAGRTLLNTNTDDGVNMLQVDGSVSLKTAGNKINITTGTNASVGTATLSSGTVTISTTAVTASSIILLTYQSCSSCGTPYISAKTAGTSFVITSSNGSDASIIAYQIIN